MPRQRIAGNERRDHLRRCCGRGRREHQRAGQAGGRFHAGSPSGAVACEPLATIKGDSTQARNSTACNEVRRGRLGWLIGVVGYWNLVSD